MLSIDESLLRELGVDTLVPPALARWRPLVLEGVLYFLGRLDPAHLAGIFAAQEALPDDAQPGDRLVALLAQCPTLHKLGQVIARHPAIPAPLRRSLRQLESLPPTTPMHDILARIEADLPPHARLTIGTRALAEASVAVVVPFSWRDGSGVRNGVFKVLKPGVAARLNDELAVWLELGDFLAQRGEELGLPALDYRDTLESVADLVANEVRLDVEQANIARAAAFHAHDPGVLIPELLPWSTPRMTAMERVFGGKVADVALPAAQRRRFADSLVSALLARPFWSRAEQAFVHGDPHAGNLFATEDGRLAVLDWSLVARLSKADREQVVDAALGGLTLDAPRICRAVAGLGTIAPDHPVLRASVERALARVRGFVVPGFDWLVSLLDDVASRTEAGFRKDLILFRKTWITLAGVIHDLAGEHSPDAALFRVALERFAHEMPERMFAPFGSRQFDTHVSNADLAGLWFTLGLVPARYWLGVARQATPALPAIVSV